MVSYLVKSSTWMTEVPFYCKITILGNVTIMGTQQQKKCKHAFQTYNTTELKKKHTNKRIKLAKTQTLVLIVFGNYVNNTKVFVVDNYTLYIVYAYISR